ncbi:Trp biosynthesis-associated membrane protein [Actinomadura viridis]|uniref:Trp biosynthesis-associated membrane protein n=1 Tax=Actinomadura viridis TaxID=58110 RepID=UPI00368EDFB2
MTPSRERGLAALLCAAGAGLALLAAGRPWATVRARDAITPFAQDLTGRDLGGAAGALGWAALAGLAALFATRGRMRAGVGVLLALFGAGIAYASATAVQRAGVLAAAGEKSALLRMGGDLAITVRPWWIVSLAGGVLLVAAGAVTVARGARWPGMSARYDRAAGAPGKARAGDAAPAASAEPAGTEPGGEAGTATPRPAVAAGDDPSALWKSLDRGEDPTAAEERRP